MLPRFRLQHLYLILIVSLVFHPPLTSLLHRVSIFKFVNFLLIKVDLTLFFVRPFLIILTLFQVSQKTFIVLLFTPVFLVKTFGCVFFFQLADAGGALFVVLELLLFVFSVGLLAF